MAQEVSLAHKNQPLDSTIFCAWHRRGLLSLQPVKDFPFEGELGHVHTEGEGQSEPGRPGTRLGIV